MVNKHLKRKFDMKRISILLASVFGLMALTTSCNDEWTEEQYEHYISFKAPLDDKGGVTSVYVPFTRHDNNTGEVLYGRGLSSFQLPMIVSGTTKNDKNFTVKVAHDTDTLGILNYEWFQGRSDLYYKDMSAYATYPETVQFKSGSDISLLDLHFDFNNIDMTEKWVLPIMVKDDGTSPYESHPRKHYGKALLRVFPYNDYSGNYSAATLLVKNNPTKAELAGQDASGQETARLYVVSEDEVFFYAGTVDEDRTDRKNYKIFAKFVKDPTDENSGTVELTTDNPEIQLEVNKQASFKIYERMDDIKPYLKHHYVIISDIDYTFRDYTLMKDMDMWYNASGTLTLERQINTQMAEEDQANDW